MEPLEILLVVGFSAIVVGVSAYICRQRRNPAMKQSPSMENLAEDPQSNDLTVVSEH